jgi:hypothetical protein
MLKKITINSTVNIYPNTKQHEDLFQSEILSEQKIVKIKNVLGKEKCSFEKYRQNEYYYKNLVKIEKSSENNLMCEYYSLEPFDYLYDNNNLIIYYNREKINGNEFPALFEYDIVYEKQIESYIFGKFEVIFETENNNTIIKVHSDKFNFNDENNISKILAKI